MRIILSLLLCWSATAWADAVSDLKNFYQKVDSLSSRFEQRLIDEDGDTLERYEGQMWLQRPGRFLWEYESPYPLMLGSDGDLLWHFDVDLSQITLRSAKASLSGTPAELLGGEVGALEHYELSELPPVEGTDVSWVALQPRGESDFSRIRIGLKGGQPIRMELNDRLGQTTLIRFQEFQANAPIDDQRFQFLPPEGVTIVDERYEES